jgi:hypothetical protein
MEAYWLSFVLDLCGLWLFLSGNRGDWPSLIRLVLATDNCGYWPGQCGFILGPRRLSDSQAEVFFRPVKFQKQVNLSNSWPSLTQVTRFEEDDCCTLFPNKVKLIGPKLSALNSPPRIKWDTGPGQEQKDAGTGGRVPLGLSDGEAHVAVGAHAICRLLPLLHHGAGPYLGSLRLLLHSCCYHHFFNIRPRFFNIRPCLVWMLKFKKYCSTFVLFDKKFSILD